MFPTEAEAEVFGIENDLNYRVIPMEDGGYEVYDWVNDRSYAYGGEMLDEVEVEWNDYGLDEFDRFGEYEIEYDEESEYSGLDIANAALASLNTAVTAQDGLMATVGQSISDFGAMGKVMGAGGKALGTAGFVMSVASGYNLIKNGNARGWLDIGMATSSVAATALMTAGLISNPVGWTIIGVTAIYGLSTAIYDLSTSSK